MEALSPRQSSSIELLLKFIVPRVTDPAVLREIEMATNYATLVGLVIDADDVNVVIQLSDPGSAKVTKLSVPRRVCRDGDQIKVGDTPIPIPATATFILHLIPLDATNTGQQHEIVGSNPTFPGLRTLGASGWNSRTMPWNTGVKSVALTHGTKLPMRKSRCSRRTGSSRYDA